MHLFRTWSKTLPYNVKVMQIRPTLDAGNQVALDMSLASANADAMVQALVALENSPLFGELLSHSMQPPTQSEPLYRYRVTVNYAQKL